ESDISPESKVLMNEYYNRPTPPVNYVFFDIENDYTQKIGYATMDNPYAPINAVTIYQSWIDSFVTYMVAPQGMVLSDKVQDTIARMWKHYGIKADPNVVICANEEELLVALLNDIQSADIISGWNSAFFDLPYIVKRLLVIRPKLVNKLCFPGCKAPRENTIEKFGNPQLTYQLHGRTHLDYIDLYRKFSSGSRPSYALGAICEDDLSVTKLDHDGSLEQLYKGTYRPDVTDMTLEDADALPDEIQRNNARREMMRRELVRRGVMKEDVNV
ncbi:3'-5' exonuclease, partial [Janthinobacterium sp.]|uniref:3'-5' exonuclease n=1 Tax=Janthinobacterium sp. TaxID=1871054 RepID=UPI00263716B3